MGGITGDHWGSLGITGSVEGGEAIGSLGGITGLHWVLPGITGNFEGMEMLTYPFCKSENPIGLKPVWGITEEIWFAV